MHQITSRATVHEFPSYQKYTKKLKLEILDFIVVMVVLTDRTSAI